MWAIAAADFGAELELVELPEPEPGPNELKVRLFAASVNPFDRKVVGGMLRLQVAALGELHFHQLFRPQHVVERPAQRVREALVADVDRDVEMMRLRAQLRALLRRQGHLSVAVRSSGYGLTGAPPVR